MVIAPARLTLWPGLLGGTFGMIIGNILLSFGWSPRLATWTVLIYGIAAGPVWPVTVMISQRIRYSTRFTSGVIGIGDLGAALGPLLGAQVIRYLGVAWFFFNRQHHVIFAYTYYEAQSLTSDYPKPNNRGKNSTRSDQ